MKVVANDIVGEWGEGRVESGKDEIFFLEKPFSPLLCDLNCWSDFRLTENH